MRCLDIPFNSTSCDYTLEMFSEEPEVNIITHRTKISIGADRPHCGKSPVFLYTLLL